MVAENQHAPDVNKHSVRESLHVALLQWEIADCDCCSPTVLDDALEGMVDDVGLWERVRRFAIDLAQTSQIIIDEAMKDDAENG